MTIEPVSRASRAALLASKDQGNVEPLDSVIIGRDVLELVSSAMYIDPMTVYREYIQNAADAIDDARRSGILDTAELSKVSIDIDSASRSIRIRDNGTGVANSEFSRKMAALGASGKRGTTARGFRGVGRLAGLGYAQELIFRSKARGDSAVGELTWDCRKLKLLLRQSDGDIESLIRSVATFRKKQVGDYPEHFFEVELRGVVRIRSDKLMSPAAVEDYLGQVAPVPFAPEFRFGEEIRAALAAVVQLGELQIHVDGSDRMIYRPHRDVVVQEAAKPITFDRLSISEISSIDGEAAAIVWILHHEYEGALPNSVGIKGLRFRSGNVQVGEYNLLEELFPEPRFNAWSVGEIHVLDQKITPNGRRDHFEQNSHYTNLINQLAPSAREIARLCRTSSIRRKWLRDVDLQRQQIEQAIDVIAQGVIGDEERKKLGARTEENFGRAAKTLLNPVFEKQDIEMHSAALDSLRRNFAEIQNLPNVHSAIGRFDEAERKAFSRFCELVYECAPNAASAKSLVDKILAKLA